VFITDSFCRQMGQDWSPIIPIWYNKNDWTFFILTASVILVKKKPSRAGEFRGDMDVETQARMLMATLHGLMVQWHREPGRVDWHAVAQEFLRGLRPC
jgi:hypothetical protein